MKLDRGVRTLKLKLKPTGIGWQVSQKEDIGMRTKRLSLRRAVCAVVVCVLLASVAQADLLTIGTATYQSNEYSLIYEEAQGLIWLDYTSPKANWDTQMTWAGGLVAQLTLNIDSSEFDVTWQEDAWRLPGAGDPPQTGDNITSAEMGHLYYVSLGNTVDNGLENMGPFVSLIEDRYRTGTDSGDSAYQFNFASGVAWNSNKRFEQYALAVREADVIVVPEPATMSLLAIGGLGVLIRRRR